MKTKGFIYTLILIVIILVFGKCNKDCGLCFTPPSETRFSIASKTDTSDLIYTGQYQEDSIRLYYMNNGVKTDIEFIVFEDTLKERTVIISQEISWKSNEGFKQFYLRLNTQETDTMFLNVVTKTEDCCTFHVVEAFRINGQELYTDHAIFAYVYLK